MKEHDAGRNDLDICREFGVSKAAFYNGASAMAVSELKRVKELEDENSGLTKMFAKLSSLVRDALRDAVAKKF